MNKFDNVFGMNELRRLSILSHEILKGSEMKEFSIYNSPEKLSLITKCLQDLSLIDETFNTVIIVNGEFQLSPFVNEALFFSLSDIKLKVSDWEDFEPIIFEYGSIGIISSSEFISKSEFIERPRMIMWIKI